MPAGPRPYVILLGLGSGSYISSDSELIVEYIINSRKGSTLLFTLHRNNENRVERSSLTPINISRLNIVRTSKC